MSKSDLIRAAIRESPNLSAAEVLELIREKHPQMKWQASEVVRLMPEPRPASAGPPPEPPGRAEPTLSEKLLRLKEAAQAVGGSEEAKRLLDLLG
jgi:hypothetical protein